MLTKKSLAVLFIVALLALPAAGLAQAQRGGFPPFGGANPPVGADAVHQLITLASEATGMTTFELMQELRSGKTLADIVTEKGGDMAALTSQAQAVITEAINKAVADGKLTQAQANLLLANLPQVLQDFSTGARSERGMFPNFGERGGRGGRGVRPMPDRANIMQLVQEKTGLTLAQIREQVLGGKTLGQILTDANVNIDEFVNEAIAPMQTRLTQQVTDGVISQALADARLALFRVELTERLNSNTPLRLRGNRR